MGLCKCPKRKVTNQFCFEHRVCVCENCMVTNHPTCVVQSYLKWLQDSDYNSVCELCQQGLTKLNSIRLICYHVFHWSCLDDYSRRLPPTTAPGGRVCPTCNAALFPPSNLVGPVADALREKLAGVNWARAGLGLPLLSEEKEIIKATPIIPKDTSVVEIGEASNIENGGAFSRLEGFHHHPGVDIGAASSNRKIFQDIRENNLNLEPFDRDDNKYKRRPFRDLLGAWWQLTFGGSSSGSRWRSSRFPSPTSFRSKFALVICGIVLLVFILFLLSNYHDRSVDNVPIN